MRMNTMNNNVCLDNMASIKMSGIVQQELFIWLIILSFITVVTDILKNSRTIWLTNSKSGKTMDGIMKILVLGAGGVGGYFGSRLHEAECDISFMVRSNRINELNRSGISIISDLGNCFINPKLLTDGNSSGSFDIIILSCKTYDLDSAIDSIGPLVLDNTLIIPLLNGVAHLKKLDNEFGQKKVAGGIAHLAVTQIQTGKIKHLNSIHKFIVGGRNHKQNVLLEQFSNICATANVDLSISQCIEQELSLIHI